MTSFSYWLIIALGVTALTVLMGLWLDLLRLDTINEWMRRRREEKEQRQLLRPFGRRIPENVMDRDFPDNPHAHGPVGFTGIQGITGLLPESWEPGVYASTGMQLRDEPRLIAVSGPGTGIDATDGPATGVTATEGTLPEEKSRLSKFQWMNKKR